MQKEGARRGEKGGGKKEKEGRREVDWMEGRVYERSNRTHFLFLLLLLFGLKWAGMASRTGEKEWHEGVEKREDRRGKRMIGGKRGERKGKCDP